MASTGAPDSPGDMQMQVPMALPTELRLEVLLQGLVDLSREALKARYGALFVIDEEGRMREIVTSGIDKATKERIGEPPSRRGLLGLAIEERRPLRLRDVSQHPRFTGFPPHHPQMRSFLAVPIVWQGIALGSLYFAEKEGAEEFSEEDEALAMLMANHSAIVIRSSRLYEGQVRPLLDRVMNIQEEERRRIAYDIHDGLGQMIVAAGMHLETFRGQRKFTEERAVEEEFRKTGRYLQEAMGETRRIVSELRPALLDEFGLAQALKHYLEDMGARVGWQVEIEESLGDLRLEPAIETALFRIAQEALTNASKHGQAQRVRLSLRLEADHLTMEIRDWGKGFDAGRVLAPVPWGQHLGLVSMRERAGLIGGTLSIHSAPGQGSLVAVRVPLSGKQEKGRNQLAKTSPGGTPMQAAMKGPITVLIADDHPMVREGLRSMLNVEEIQVVGEAENGLRAIEMVRQLQPDLVLMDVRMPDMDGLEATEIVKQEAPAISVLMLTSYESKDYLKRAITAGASGYLLKGTPRETLIDAIRVTRGGGSLIDAKLLSELLSELGVADTPIRATMTEGIESLSPREREVLQLLVQGLTNKEIAREMHYSVGTVKNVVQRVIGKLGVSDRTQAAVYAVRSGLAANSFQSPPP